MVDISTINPTFAVTKECLKEFASEALLKNPEKKLEIEILVSETENKLKGLFEPPGILKKNHRCIFLVRMKVFTTKLEAITQ